MIITQGRTYTKEEWDALTRAEQEKRLITTAEELYTPGRSEDDI